MTMKTLAMTLVDARAQRLMGKAESWDRCGGKPVSDCPDKVLKSARGWFKHKIREGPPSELKDAMKHQVTCINLVLEDREANSPQCDLMDALKDSLTPTKPPTDAELLERVTAPDVDDGLPF